MLFEQNWQNWQNWQVTKSSRDQVLQTLPTSMIRLEILLISSSLEANSSAVGDVLTNEIPELDLKCLVDFVDFNIFN